MVYVPESQNPANVSASQMYIRAGASPSVAIANIRRWLAASHPGITSEFRVFQTQIEESFLRERLMAALSGFFGALAALLAVIGLYGVMSYMMEQRRNEIGIRLALGARPPAVVSLVMKETAVLLIVGLALGAVSSLVLARATGSLLFGLTAHDPLTLALAAGLLAAAVAAGSYLPARRASRLDPMTALRCD
jgi:ABC-type antimicrobial peptide transport system permease subunit